MCGAMTQAISCLHLAGAFAIGGLSAGHAVSALSVDGLRWLWQPNHIRYQYELDRLICRGSSFSEISWAL
jgi:hypothetical protein